MITVGGADEAGSSGFNQIQNKYVYGGKALDGTVLNDVCEPVSAYTSTGNSQVNHYDPGQNLMAKAVWLAGKQGNCGRSFRNAFNGTHYNGTYNSSTDTPLVKIITGTEIEAITSGNHTDDNYEKLTKALGGYNQGASIFKNGAGNAWVSLLINQPSPNSATYKKLKKDYSTLSEANKKRYALITAMKYGLSVMHDSDKLALPYRKYIWQGGAAELDDPNTDNVDESKPAWCFSYGESEWLAGDTFKNIKAAAEGSLTKAAEGRVDCITGIKI